MSSSFEEVGSIAEFVNGAAFRPEDWGELGTRIIRIQNLNDSSKPFNRTTRELPSRLHVQPGDLLVSWSASLGVFEWRGPDVAFLNQHIFRVIPDEQRVDKRYLRHGLDLALSDMQRHLHGATMQHVNRGEFLSTKIYLPPLAEQQWIAAILDKANALRAMRLAAIAKLDTLVESIFLDMFGDPTTNPRRLPIAVMGDVCDVRDGTHDSPKYVSNGGYPLVTSRNVTSGRVDLTDVNYISETDYTQINKRSKVDRGDILLPMIGTIGSPVLVDHDPRFAIKNVALIKFSEVSPSAMFVHHLLNGHYFNQMVSRKNRGGTQKFVSLADLRAFPLPLPSRHAQSQFASRVEAVNRMRLANKAFGHSLDALFASLQHRAFRGEL